MAPSFFSALNPLDRRNRISDFLMNFHFHVLDVSFAAPTVFTPVFGFRACTAPEITITEKTIKEATFEYPRTVVAGAEVGNIEFQQGARFFNSDFYEWIRAVVRGKSNQRKNLLIIQYSQIGVANLPGAGGGLNLGFTPISDLVSRVPARAWLLIDTIPVQYRASNDFDAQAPDISIMELRVKPYYIEEFSMGATAGIVSTIF